MDEKINIDLEKDEVEELEMGQKEKDAEVNDCMIKLDEQIKDKKRAKEDKGKKKDDKKLVEHILRSLSDIPTIDEKLDIICKRYCEVVDENRKMQLTLKQTEKKVSLLQREREQFQNERSKAALTRRKLETLCRELQKQSRLVKEESLVKLREQEELRKELSEKFQGGLAQITTLMNQNIEKNAQMYEENLEMNRKFKSLYEQVELKEQELLKVHQEMRLNLQIANAKLAKVKVDATVEKEAFLVEKQQLLHKVAEYQSQIKELQATEVGLRTQVTMYTDKYDEFQNALTRSNKVYGEFNMEMEKMSKKMLTLEKETGLWKQRWEKSHSALLDMAADKQAKDAEMTTLNKKLVLLQDLCKMFQCERSNLLAQLKEKTVVSELHTTLTKSSDTKKLENDVSELQDPLNEVSELTQKMDWFGNDSKIATTDITNNNIVKQESETVQTELDESAEYSSTDTEDKYSVLQRNTEKSSKSEENVNEAILEDDVTEMQKAEYIQEDASKTEITDEELDKLLEESELKNGYNNLIELLETDETGKETEIIESEENDEFVIVEQFYAEHKEVDEVDGIRYIRSEQSQTVPNSGPASSKAGTSHTLDATVQPQTKKQDTVSGRDPGLSKLAPEEVSSIVEKSMENVLNNQPNEEVDVNVNNNFNELNLLEANMEKKKDIKLLESTTSNLIGEDSESHIIENEDNRKICKKIINETLETITELSTVSDTTLSEDLTHNNSNRVVESNTSVTISEKEDIHSTLEDSKSLDTQTEDNTKLLEDNTATAAKDDATSVIEIKSECIESIDTVDAPSSNLINDRFKSSNTDETKDVCCENISELVGITCIAATPLKEEPAKSEGNCVEKKSNKSSLAKNKRKRK